MSFLRRRRQRVAWKTEARQNEVTFSWRFLGHVAPLEEPKPGEERSLIYYLGPNHYPAGLYFPQGYNLEIRDGDDPGWSIIRARCCATEQVMTMWALEADTEERPGATLTERDYES